MLAARPPRLKVVVEINSHSHPQPLPTHYKCFSPSGIRLPSKWLRLILVLRLEQEKWRTGFRKCKRLW
jgi:hypothetical protein